MMLTAIVRNGMKVASSWQWVHASLFIVLASIFASAGVGYAAPLRIATFKCDITPLAGEPMVWATRLRTVMDPLLAKGVVIEDGTNRYVLCALDWCLLANESQWEFRQALAKGANTDPANVAVQCLHQHAAPSLDEGAYGYLGKAPEPLPRLSERFIGATKGNLAKAAREAVTNLQPFDRIGAGEAKVEKAASARRLKDETGKIIVRFSNGAKDPKLAAAPEGDIDPLLKTITFAQGDKPLVRLHYYATHPQTFCCDGRASSDVVGLAREDFEATDKTFEIYFTGCAGDVTLGKYSDGTPATQTAIRQRLAAGMQSATANTHYYPATNLIWRTNAFVLPLRGETEAVKAESQARVNDPKQGESSRVYLGAMRLSFIARLGKPIEVSSLQIGPVRILNLPGEPMLEFQRYAQRSRPEDFVAVAGYGDCGPAYICTDQAIAEGGYEPGSANVGKGSEAKLKAAIDALLGQPRK